MGTAVFFFLRARQLRLQDGENQSNNENFLRLVTLAPSLHFNVGLHFRQTTSFVLTKLPGFRLPTDFP